MSRHTTHQAEFAKCPEEVTQQGRVAVLCRLLSHNGSQPATNASIKSTSSHDFILTDRWHSFEEAQVVVVCMCCLLVLDSVTFTPQCIRQPRARVYLKDTPA